MYRNVKLCNDFFNKFNVKIEVLSQKHEQTIHFYP